MPRKTHNTGIRLLRSGQRIFYSLGSLIFYCTKSLDALCEIQWVSLISWPTTVLGQKKSPKKKLAKNGTTPVLHFVMNQNFNGISLRSKGDTKICPDSQWDSNPLCLGITYAV